MLLKYMISFLLCCWISVSTGSSVRQLNVLFEKGGIHNFDYQLSGEYVVSEGDIIIAKQQDITPGAVVVNYPQKLWPHAILPFVIDSSLTINARSAIYLAMLHYQRYTNIRFVERTSKNHTNYPDYVRFQSGSGCSSYVGKQGGEQPIVLQSGCGYGATIHEIGHALGFWHEQNRQDRDQFVTIHFDNIVEDKKHNFRQYPNQSMDVGEYDYDSIMHYSANAFSKNGQATISVLNNRHDIGQRQGLSQGDLAAIKLLYVEPSFN